SSLFPFTGKDAKEWQFHQAIQISRVDKCAMIAFQALQSAINTNLEFLSLSNLAAVLKARNPPLSFLISMHLMCYRPSSIVKSIGTHALKLWLEQRNDKENREKFQAAIAE